MESCPYAYDMKRARLTEIRTEMRKNKCDYHIAECIINMSAAKLHFEFIIS